MRLARCLRFVWFAGPLLLASLAGYFFYELSATNDALAASRATVTQQAAQISNLELQAADLETTRSALLARTAHLAESTETLNSLNQQHASLQADHAELLSEVAAIKADRDHLRLQYRDLEQATAGVEDLERQMVRLAQSIEVLKKRRLPLLNTDTFEGYYRCTGSMDPAITCLDLTTNLRKPTPEEVVVGAIIAYEPGCWKTSGVTHRVLEIKIIDGEQHYWTKGDANRLVDGCWVPHSNVKSYVVGIERNRYPENATLRGLVNESRQAYYALLDRYCGVAVDPNDCSVTPDQHVELSKAYHVHQCWLNVARASIRPGQMIGNC